MGHHASWLDRAIDVIKPQPGSPPKPRAPGVDQNAWNQSVEQKHVVPGLTVRDVGLSVFGETRSLRDRPGSNEPIDAARQKVAHAIINGAEEARRHNEKPPKVHGPIQPHDLGNPEERAAYESSLSAAREAYLSGHILPRARLTSASRRRRLERIRSTREAPERAYRSAPNPARTTILTSEGTLNRIVLGSTHTARSTKRINSRPAEVRQGLIYAQR